MVAHQYAASAITIEKSHILSQIITEWDPEVNRALLLRIAWSTVLGIYPSDNEMNSDLENKRCQISYQVKKKIGKTRYKTTDSYQETRSSPKIKFQRQTQT